MRGYDRATVDAVIDQARQALAAGGPDERAAARQALRQGLALRLRGYDRGQVDEYLEKLEKQLA